MTISENLESRRCLLLLGYGNSVFEKHDTRVWPLLGPATRTGSGSNGLGASPECPVKCVVLHWLLFDGLPFLHHTLGCGPQGLS